ncbi:unnamed protein product [Effrenium voratum]|uniref:Pre-mRNA processing factor 4 (PRP4)-like domain-containing protein n=1 Tax=Effrenium voratum TaxID=2562239 RepID=A0AA36N316_9DINO|nr:unnamed protein product [Effrenium voratum]
MRPPLSVEDIITRFREMCQPIILFGETDMQRYKRMRQLEKEDHEGKKNPDLVMLESLHSNSRTALEDQKGDDDEDEDEDGEKKEEKDKADDKSEESESEEATNSPGDWCRVGEFA